MKRKFSACQMPRSMYLSIFNSFLVIRTASANNLLFHVPQPTFLLPLETPLRLSCNMFHGWRDNSLPNPSQHVPIYLQQFTQVQKIAVFTYRSPHFCFPISHNMFHGWRDNSMLAKPLAACTYLSSIVSELYDS